MVDCLARGSLRWLWRNNALSSWKVTSRYSSFRSSSREGPPESYTKVEISNNPEEWKFVERLLPPKLVPQPLPKTEYASGWVPPKESAVNQPYFVQRTKNLMPPVYLNLSHRGMKKITNVKKIQGDIWLLEKDLKTFLQGKTDRMIATQVHEVTGQVNVKGDYANHVKEWLFNKGF